MSFKQHPFIYLSSTFFVASALSVVVVSVVYKFTTPMQTEPLTVKKSVPAPARAEKNKTVAGLPNSQVNSASTLTSPPDSQSASNNAWQPTPTDQDQIAEKPANELPKKNVIPTQKVSLPAESPQTSPKQPTQNKKYKTRWRTNVRAGADKKFDVVATLKENRTVNVENDPGGKWVEIKSVGVTGWVYRPLLQPWEPE